ncbi:hypothetical protein VNI00_002803 [Paramarasmius palmivorus]|uniref:Methyltransferase domain-containing protein n=1 Tax=Paramarasmius palmivorus TaxID=297713 RepID=A0AAW0DVC5_9AGAR
MQVYKLWVQIREKGGYLDNVPSQVLQMLEDAGFCDVSAHIKAPPRLGRRLGNQEGEEALEIEKRFLNGAKDAVMAHGGLGVVKDEKEFDALVERFVKEEEDGEGDSGWERLNRQFQFYYKKFYNHNLIINPGITISPASAVLDAATGTGAWILSLAKELPASVSLHAVDLAPALWLPSEAPPNVQYTVSSVTSLPKEWDSKFDFVHQSLLSGSLKATEWPLYIAELYRVTKPSGYIQLFEVTGIPAYSEPPEGTAARQVYKLWVRVKEKGGYLDSAPSQVPQMLEDAGFCDVSVHIKAPPRLGRRLGNQEGEEALEIDKEFLNGAKDAVMSHGGLGVVKDEKEFDALVERFVKEEEDGEGNSGWEMCFICARKPL